MNSKARKYIEKFQLKIHPEGGYYKEVYRAGELILTDHLPKRYKSGRNFSTSIYFLLEGNQVSNFHRLKSDEQWHFYDGSTVVIYQIEKNGNLKKLFIGNKIDEGESFQATVYRNTWFGAELLNKTSFALIGCTVSPGFDFGDFEIGKRAELINEFPGHESIITKLTR